MVHERVESIGDTPTPAVYWVVLFLVASLLLLFLSLSTLHPDYQALDGGFDGAFDGAWDMNRLTETDINSLPVRRYAGSETPATRNGSQEDLASRVMDDLAVIGALEVFDGVEELQCSICQDQVQDNQKVKTLPCAHEFHLECIDGWLSGNPTCPLCRQRPA